MASQVGEMKDFITKYETYVMGGDREFDPSNAKTLHGAKVLATQASRHGTGYSQPILFVRGIAVSGKEYIMSQKVGGKWHDLPWFHSTHETRQAEA